MSTLDIRSTLEAAGVTVRGGGRWLRIQAAWRGGAGFNVGVHCESGAWVDHAQGDKGGWRDLCLHLGIEGASPVVRNEAAIAASITRETNDTARRIDQARRAYNAGDRLDDPMFIKISTGQARGVQSNRQITKALRPFAHIIWARDYLQGRGDGLMDVAIRAGVRVLRAGHKAAQGRPCLVWPIRDPRTGEIVGVQREWGRGHDNKKMLGRALVEIDPTRRDGLKCAGGFAFPPAPEAPDGDGRGRLFICEGQISAAAVSSAFPGAWVVPHFSTAGISSPARVILENAIKKGVSQIVMAGDSGAPGVKAAAAGIRKIQTFGLAAEILWTVPPEERDWADVLENDGLAAVRAAVEAGMRPVPTSTPGDEIRNIKPWRPIKRVADLPGDDLPKASSTLSVKEARRILSNGLTDQIEDYIRFLRQKKQKKPKARCRPRLVRVTTGVGKSTLLKDLINNAKLLAAGGACLVLVPDHDQADAYEAAGWWHYHGRNPDPASPGYCPNFDEMMAAVEKGHIPQNAFCRTCKHGLAWSIQHHGETSKLGQKSLTLLRSQGYRPEDVEPCVWQGHLRETQQQTFVVAPQQSYSETLAKQVLKFSSEGDDEDDGTRSVHRLVLCDEHVVGAQSIEAGLEDIDLWAKRAAKAVGMARDTLIIARIHTGTELNTIDHRVTKAEELARDTLTHAEIVALESASAMFPVLARELARWVGKSGRIQIDDALLHAINKITEAAGKDATARWERLVFKPDGELAIAPLRAAYAIAQTLKYGDGHVDNGKLCVSATRPIVERVLKGLPVAFFDATPDPVTTAIVMANDGVLVDAVARQNVKIVRYPQRFWGLKPFSWGATRDQKDRAAEKYRTIVEMWPESGNLFHMKARWEIDPDKDNPLIRHWGEGHRAHDDFAGRSLSILGSFFPPMGVWRATYQAARIAALSAGAPEADWPAWSDDMQMEGGVWIAEGDHEVQSYLPLPADPKIREWLLAMITNETVQAIGRARGANLDEPVEIRIFGGVPLHNLAQYGLQVSEYRADPEKLGPSRMGARLGARQGVAAAMADGATTIRQIRDWLMERTGKAPGEAQVRRLRKEFEAIARRDAAPVEKVFEVVSKRADALILEADGDLARAARMARAADDREAGLLIEAARHIVVDYADDTSDVGRTGPPAVA